MAPDPGLSARTEQTPKIFISYSRKDIAFADRLAAVLEQRGFEPLIDRSDIYAFEDWWERIEGLIGRADTVVFVLSPDAVQSDVALKEIAHAASLNKRFAPIVCRRVESDTVPEALRRLNFIFFDEPEKFDRGIEQLSEALQTDIGWIRQHTEFGEATRRWIAVKASPGLLLRSPALEEAERWIASRPRGAPEPTTETQSFIRQSRQAATRRRNVLTGSLAAGLVLALGLAGLAYWQRGVAVEQRSIAQQNEAQANQERDNATRSFKLAQKTAESLVFDIAQGLRNVQGMSAGTVRKILETARATFEQLATSAPENLPLQRSRAAMLDEFGATYLTLGDLEQALKAYRDSLAIFERLTAADPSNTRWQRDLSVSYEKIGDVLVAQGKLDEALKAYRDSLTIRERLAADDPSDMQSQIDQWERDPFTSYERDLLISYTKIGDVLVAQGELDDALDAYRNAVFQRPVVADASNTPWQRDVSVVYDRVGNVLVAQGNLDEALKAFRDGLAITQRLASADPSNTLRQRNLSISYEKIGHVLARQGKLDEALKTYRNGLAIRGSLGAADPGNTLWQRDLSILDEKVGDVLVAQGKLDDAIKAYRDALAIAEFLADVDRSNTQWQRDLSVSYEKIGNVLATQGKPDEALKAYRDGLTIAERLAAADRSNAEWQRDLSVSYDKIGNVQVAQGKLDEALKAYRDSLAIAERLAAVDRSNTQWQRDLSVSYEKIGDVLARQGRLDEALKAYRDCLTIRERLAATDRSNTLWQRDLSISYDSVGNVLVRQGKLDEALRAYRDGLAVAERLAAADRSNTQWQSDLQIRIGHIGRIAKKFILAGNFVTALQAADQAISLSPEQTWLYANRAHALMLLNRLDEAGALYLQYRDAKKVIDEQPWVAAILEDFAELRKAGLAHPLMDEIEQNFAAGRISR